jgi:hypothetical protein
MYRKNNAIATAGKTRQLRGTKNAGKYEAGNNAGKNEAANMLKSPIGIIR